jgi:hypothetical protein
MGISFHLERSGSFLRPGSDKLPDPLYLIADYTDFECNQQYGRFAKNLT